MIRETDEIIWYFCLNGDRKAFAELYKRYYSLLYNYGCKFSTDEGLVKDCIQNLFVKLIQDNTSLPKVYSVKAYLLISFRHRLYDSLKERSNQNKMFLPCIDEVLSFEKELIPYAPEEEQSDDFMIMHQAFRELSSRQQEILYLYYMLGATHADIVEILNINYQSSKNLLFRSLLKLKEHFFLKWEEQKKSADPDLKEDIDLFSNLIHKFNWYQVKLEE